MTTTSADMFAALITPLIGALLMLRGWGLFKDLSR